LQLSCGGVGIGVDVAGVGVGIGVDVAGVGVGIGVLVVGEAVVRPAVVCAIVVENINVGIGVGWRGSGQQVM